MEAVQDVFGTEEFMPIDFPIKSFAKELRTGYRVYKDPKEFVLVEAELASEAIEKSGITDPYKVMKAEILETDVLEEDSLQAMQEETAAPATEAIPTPQEEPTGQPAPAEEKKPEENAE